MPIAISDNLEGHKAVVHDAILGREALKECELDVTHRCSEFTVVLRYRLFAGIGTIQTVESRPLAWREKRTPWPRIRTEVVCGAAGAARRTDCSTVEQSEINRGFQWEPN
jgi:hypothetical protein